MPTEHTAPEPGRAWRLASALATLGLAVFFVVMAVLSWSVGHGDFSGGVGIALVLWALLVGAAGLAWARGVRWVRGAVIAAGLLHVFAFGQFALNQPLAAFGALAGLVSVVGAVVPQLRAGRPS